MQQSYDWNNNIIQFEDKYCNKFNLQLRGKITIVTGDSASGKTLLCNKLKSIKHDKNLSKQIYRADNIFLVNDDNIDALINQKKKLIIIDRAEQILTSDIVDSINQDKDNRFLIFTRKPIGIIATPNHFAEMQLINGELTLQYKFNVRGWC